MPLWGVSGEWSCRGEGGNGGKGTYFVAFIDELMGSSDELETVHVVEFRGYFVSE